MIISTRFLNRFLLFEEKKIRSSLDYYSLYTDVVLFFFSFFSKTSASARAKRVRESETERGARES